MIAQAKARYPEFPGRFFNVGFVIEPEDGTVVLTHHKLVPLLPVEHSVTPHNVWDRWTVDPVAPSTRSIPSPTPPSAGSAS